MVVLWQLLLNPGVPKWSPILTMYSIILASFPLVESVLQPGDNWQRLKNIEPAARALGKKLVDAVREGYIDPVQDAILSDNRGYFKAIVEESKDLRADDYARWVRMGWIK